MNGLAYARHTLSRMSQQISVKIKLQNFEAFFLQF